MRFLLVFLCVCVSVCDFRRLSVYARRLSVYARCECVMCLRAGGGELPVRRDGHGISGRGGEAYH